MYIFWAAIALIAWGSYAYLGWKIWRASVRQFHRPDEVVLPGTRARYKIARVSLAFVGVSTIAYTLSAIARSQPTLRCWFPLALIIGLLELYSVTQRTKHLKFEDERVHCRRHRFCQL